MVTISGWTSASSEAQADDEFPAVAFTLPAHLDRFWRLDAVYGLLNLVTQELLQAAPEELS